jgi:hypothetical protein
MRYYRLDFAGNHITYAFHVTCGCLVRGRGLNALQSKIENERRKPI